MWALPLLLLLVECPGVFQAFKDWLEMALHIGKPGCRESCFCRTQYCRSPISAIFQSLDIWKDLQIKTRVFSLFFFFSPIGIDMYGFAKALIKVRNMPVS